MERQRAIGIFRRRAFLDLLRGGLRHRIVRHRRSHHERVGVGAGSQRRIQHLASGFHLHQRHSGGRRCAVDASDERHLSATVARRLGQREAHQPARTIAEKAHGINRLARAASRDDDTPTRKVAPPRQQAANGGENRGCFWEAPHADRA